MRPEWEGLRLDPCLPPSWNAARMTRPWRGATVEVAIERGAAAAIEVDGKRIEGNLLAPVEKGQSVRVMVRIP